MSLIKDIIETYHQLCLAADERRKEIESVENCLSTSAAELKATFAHDSCLAREYKRIGDAAKDQNTFTVLGISRDIYIPKSQYCELLQKRADALSIKLRVIADRYYPGVVAFNRLTYQYWCLLNKLKERGGFNGSELNHLFDYYVCELFANGFTNDQIIYAVTKSGQILERNIENITISFSYLIGVDQAFQNTINKSKAYKIEERKNLLKEFFEHHVKNNYLVTLFGSRRYKINLLRSKRETEVTKPSYFYSESFIKEYGTAFFWDHSTSIPQKNNENNKNEPHPPTNR